MKNLQLKLKRQMELLNLIIKKNSLDKINIDLYIKYFRYLDAIWVVGDEVSMTQEEVYKRMILDGNAVSFLETPWKELKNEVDKYLPPGKKLLSFADLLDSQWFNEDYIYPEHIKFDYISDLYGNAGKELAREVYKKIFSNYFDKVLMCISKNSNATRQDLWCFSEKKSSNYAPLAPTDAHTASTTAPEPHTAVVGPTTASATPTPPSVPHTASVGPTTVPEAPTPPSVDRKKRKRSQRGLDGRYWRLPGKRRNNQNLAHGSQDNDGDTSILGL